MISDHGIFVLLVFDMYERFSIRRRPGKVILTVELVLFVSH
jgi:uncharacterized membrane protein YobD (UPF0266 family)